MCPKFTVPLPQVLFRFGGQVHEVRLPPWPASGYEAEVAKLEVRAEAAAVLQCFTCKWSWWRFCHAQAYLNCDTGNCRTCNACHANVVPS